MKTMLYYNQYHNLYHSGYTNQKFCHENNIPIKTSAKRLFYDMHRYLVMYLAKLEI